jgi:hypothetical protein
MILVALTWLTCSSRRAPLAKRDLVGSPPVAGAPEGHPDGERIVRLSSDITDTSCLDRRGGTVVAEELSDDDVRWIEALIREVDVLPIMMIGHSTFWVGRHDAGCPEFEAMTGAGCGPLAGHGTVYRISRVEREWRIAVSGSWFS